MKWLDSDLNKFKGVKTGREQTCPLLENLVLQTVRIISSFLGFGLYTYTL